MSYLRFDDSLLHVPGKLDPDEMAYLAALAAQVPAGGHIVEIGPFYGRSTRVMGLANPKARITSIDTFEDVDWTRRYAARHPDIPKFGAEAFARFTADLPHAEALTGPSPEIAEGWTRPIDLYFEDAVHGNPVLAQNIAFWTAHLKPGGIACGHDYTLRFPDIKREVDALAARWGAQVALVGSLWALRKPQDAGADPGTSTRLPQSFADTPPLVVKTKNKRGGVQIARGGFWCGSHLSPDRLLWCYIKAPTLPPDVRLEARLGHPEHGFSDWMTVEKPAALRADLGRPLPFDRLALRLTGPPTGLSIGYKVSARQIGGGGSARSGTSPQVFDGAWACAPSEGLALNALTVALYDNKPPDAQSAFPEKNAAAKSQRVLHRALRGLRKTLRNARQIGAGLSTSPDGGPR